MTAAGVARGRRAVVLVLLLTALQLVLAAPASAHAELVGTDPAEGSRLDRPPAQITLEFTEGVDLVSGGLRLLDADGAEMRTPEATVQGTTVSWPMPEGLVEGAYIVSWRVLSSDTHPVSGAFSFGVGVEAADATAAVTPRSVTWTVVGARFLGYLGFAVLLGFLTIAVWCWPSAADRPSWLRAAGLAAMVLGVLATVAGLLAQGPYVAGLPLRELADARLLGETSHTAFGGWMQIRFFVYVALIAVVWQDPTFRWRMTRWLSVIGAIGLTVTFSGTSHAAASGRWWDRAVDSVHVLAAGAWTGGLLLLAAFALPRLRDGLAVGTLARFSRFAFTSVVVLVATGSISSVIHLARVEDLWTTPYGRLLTAKLLVVLAALAAAAVSRRFLRTGAAPTRSVQVEAAATVVVLGLTSVLAMTAPPSSAPTSPTPASSAGPAAQKQDVRIVEMDLGKGRTARLHVTGLTTSGSRLRLEALDAEGEPVPLTEAELKVSLAERDLGPLDIALREEGRAWLGEFSFPLPGSWQLALTVHDRSLAGVVTTGELTIVQ